MHAEIQFFDSEMDDKKIIIPGPLKFSTNNEVIENEDGTRTLGEPHFRLEAGVAYWEEVPQ